MNNSSARVRIVSDPQWPSVHTYFDICPESPDGTRIAYTRFTSGIPGRSEDPKSGLIVVASLNGEGEKNVGEFRAAKGHTGAHVGWIDDSTLSYEDEGRVHFVNIHTGKERSFSGGCQMYHPLGIGGGALFCPKPIHPSNEFFPQGLYVLNPETGKVQCILSLDQLMGTGWLKNRGHCSLSHAKWSPTAGRVATRVTEKDKETARHIFSCKADGSDLIHFTYFQNGEYHKPMHWNFFDDESFYGYDVSQKTRPCCRWALDGTMIETIHEGDGNHGCLSETKNYLVTDSWYDSERIKVMFYRKGDTEPVVLSETPQLGFTDVHPSLSRDQKKVYFNANLTGHGSQVCSMDLSDLLVK